MKLLNTFRKLMAEVVMLIGLILTIPLTYLELPRPWTLVIALLAVLAMGLVTLRMEGIQKGLEERLRGSIHPVLNPYIVPWIFPLITLVYARGAVEGLLLWSSLTESKRILTLILAWFTVLLGWGLVRKYVLPILPRKK